MKWMQNYNKDLILALLSVFVVSVFLITCQTYINVIFLTAYPKSFLSYLFFANAISLILLSLFLLPIIAENKRVINLSLLTIIGLTVSGFFIYNLYTGRHHAFILSVVLLTIMPLVENIVWGASTQFLRIQEIKRHLGTLNSTSILGLIFCGFSLPLLIHWFGASVIFVMLLLTLISLLLMVPRIKVVFQKTSFKDEGKYTFQYPLFKNYALYSACMLMIITMADFMLKAELGSHYDEAQIGSFMGYYFGITSVIALLLSLLQTRSFMNYFGSLALLIIPPVIAVFAAFGMASVPGIMTIAALAGGLEITMNVYERTAGTAISNVLPTKVLTLGSLQISGIIRPIILGLGAALLWILGPNAGVYSTAVVVILAGLTAVIIFIFIKKSYLRTLYNAILQMRFRIEKPQKTKEFSREVIKVARECFASGDINQKIYALTLLQELKFKRIPIFVKKAYHDLAPLHKISVVKILSSNFNQETEEFLLKALSLEHNPNLIWEITFNSLKNATHNIKNYWLAALHSHPDHILKEVCIHAVIAKCSTGSEQVQAKLQLKKFFAVPSGEIKIYMAECAQLFPINDFLTEILMLVDDANPKVAMYALQTLQQYSIDKSPYIDLLINRIGFYEASSYASEILISLGDSIVTPIMAKLNIESNFKKMAGLVNTLLFLKNTDVVAELMKVYRNSHNILLKHIIAKNIFYRALRSGLDDKSIAEIREVLAQEANIVLSAYQLSLKEPDMFVREECWSRYQLYLKQFLFLYAAICYFNLANVDRSLLYANPKDLDEDKLVKRHKAVELLYEVAESRTTKKYVENIFSVEENNLSQQNLAASKALLVKVDPWLNYVIYERHLKTLRITMEDLQKIMLLRSTRLFHDLASETLLLIARELRKVDMFRGQIIFQQDEPGDGMYIIASGKVAIKRDQKQINSLSKSDVFGELALIDAKARFATAEAAEDGLLYFLEKDLFDQLVDEIPEILRAAARMIARYLHQNAPQ